MSIKLKFPPRKVPFFLKTLNLFGGTTSLIGWIFLVVGLIINLILIPAIDFRAYVDLSGDAVIDNQGNLKTSSPVKALASLILPCISVFIFLIIILLMMS